ncbi:MAG: hotdog fold thioesterase [Chitinophagales bacterium]|nr:hotdog fold thioesterase [Chitinophagales bacterium]
MSIWKSPQSLEELKLRAQNTMGQFLEMEFLELGEDFLKMRMPVIGKTKQPMGLLHGGATAALAETIGSVSAVMCVDAEKESIVGLELNINHLRAVKDGFVYAKCSPFHLGRTTHVWNIEIKDENDRMVSVARLTTMVVKKH